LALEFDEAEQFSGENTGHHRRRTRLSVRRLVELADAGRSRGVAADNQASGVVVSRLFEHVPAGYREPVRYTFRQMFWRRLSGPGAEKATMRSGSR
jgi:hypothetical protein